MGWTVLIPEQPYRLPGWLIRYNVNFWLEIQYDFNVLLDIWYNFNVWLEISVSIKCLIINSIQFSMSDDTLGRRINCQGVQWRWVRGEAHACWVLCCESPLFCSLSFVLELPQVSLMMFHMPAEFYAVSPYFSLCFSLFLCLVLCLICPEFHWLMLLSSMPQVTPLELHLSLFGWQWLKSKFNF